MRSKDLARMAGVTVRTLRHYHKIGLLDEPKRDNNNYRRYDVHHLIRLLRIKRLSEIGFSLDNICHLLDGGGAKAQDALGTLDRELDAQIKRLARQRELIAAVSANKGAPDLPVELARLDDVFLGDMQEFTREHWVLLAHVVGDEAFPVLLDQYRHLTSPDFLALGQRFDRLDAKSGDDEVSALAGDFWAALQPLIPNLIDLNVINRGGGMLLMEHFLAKTNPSQRRVIEHLLRSAEHFFRDRQLP